MQKPCQPPIQKEPWCRDRLDWAFTLSAPLSWVSPSPFRYRFQELRATHQETFQNNLFPTQHCILTCVQKCGGGRLMP